MDDEMRDQFYAEALATRIILGALIGVVCRTPENVAVLEKTCLDALEAGETDHIPNSEVVRNKAIDVVQNTFRQIEPR